MGHCLKKHTKEKENILISPVWEVTPEHQNQENDESRNELFGDKYRSDNNKYRHIITVISNAKGRNSKHNVHLLTEIPISRHDQGSLACHLQHSLESLNL